MSRSCTYVSRNSPKYERIVFRRLLEGKKYPYDIRKTCKFKIQIWK